MKALILLALLTGCGSDDSKKGTDTPPTAAATAMATPEVLRMELTQIYCSEASQCDVNVQAAIPEMNWGVAVTYGEGKAPASCTAANSTFVGPYGAVQIEHLKPGTTYQFRTCGWNQETNQYTPGITKDFTTVLE